MERVSSENWENWFWLNWPCSWSRATRFSWPCVEGEKCAIKYMMASLLVHQGPDSHSHLFSLFNEQPTKCICSLRANKLVSCSNVVDVIWKCLPMPLQRWWGTVSWKQSAIFANLRQEKIQIAKRKIQSPLPNHSKTKYPPPPAGESREKMLAKC